MNVIQQLETLGQSGSLKQFVSAEFMLNHYGLDSEILETVRLKSQELYCIIEPDDDDDEK